jgi:hypothetical protein
LAWIKWILNYGDHYRSSACRTALLMEGYLRISKAGVKEKKERGVYVGGVPRVIVPFTNILLR